MQAGPESSNLTTLINGISYNATTLEHWNYTLYRNGTLSNGSDCHLAFGFYQPFLVSANGTFVNSTSCYEPINSIKARGIAGLVFGSLFASSILFSTVNLRKHGRAYLPRERRWKPVGRRWPWYWTVFLAACGLLSGFAAIDVDRDYVVNTPMIIQCFFLTLMTPALLACVWEAVRSWSSFRQRLIQDADNFAFPPDDRRAKIECYLPVIFYALDGLLFFTLIPRSWSFVQRQRSPSQALDSARPVALDVRFKLASTLSAVCFGLIIFRFMYSSRAYRSQIPRIFVLIASLLASRVAYALAGSWSWELSPFRLGLNAGWLYGLGYGPTILILILLNLRGFLEENEDKILISRRSSRGDDAVDNSLDIDLRSTTDRSQRHVGRPPPWWFKSRKEASSPSTRSFSPSSSRMQRLVDSKDAGPSSNHADEQDEGGHSWWQRRRQVEEDTRYRKTRPLGTETGVGWPSAEDDTASTSSRWTERGVTSMQPRGDEQSPRAIDVGENGDSVYGPSHGRRSEAASSTNSLSSRPQVVRSMLGV